MAILSSCCCWRSVRRGSFASGFYTLIYYLVLVIGGTFQVETTGGQGGSGPAGAKTSKQAQDEEERSGLYTCTAHHPPLPFTVFVLVCAGMSVFASIVLLVGLSVDNRLMLLPWIASVAVSTCVCFIYTVYLIATMSFEPILAAIFTLDFFLSLLNVYSLLCVISQYQEYKDRRGRSEDWFFQAPVKFEPWGSCPGDRRKVTFQENGLTPVVGGGGALKRKKDNGCLEEKTLLTVDDTSRRHRPRIHFQEPGSSSDDTSDCPPQPSSTFAQRALGGQFSSPAGRSVVFQDSPSTDTTSSKLPSEASSLVVLSPVIREKRVQFNTENELSSTDVQVSTTGPKPLLSAQEEEDQPPAYTISPAGHSVSDDPCPAIKLVSPNSDSSPLLISTPDTIK